MCTFLSTNQATFLVYKLTFQILKRGDHKPGSSATNDGSCKSSTRVTTVAQRLEVCRPGSAWKPRLGLVFERLHEIEARASGLRPYAVSAWGRLRLRPRLSTSRYERALKKTKLTNHTLRRCDSQEIDTRWQFNRDGLHLHHPAHHSEAYFHCIQARIGLFNGQCTAPAQAAAHGFENFELEPWAVRGRRDGLATAWLAPAGSKLPRNLYQRCSNFPYSTHFLFW